MGDERAHVDPTRSGGEQGGPQEQRPADCPSCGAPDGKPPAGPCADTYHGPVVAPSADDSGLADLGEWGAPQAEEPKLLPADERYMFSGPELRSMLLEVGGAVSGVFLRRDPELVMPADDVEDSVYQWIEQSGPQLDKAMLAARKAPHEQEEQIRHRAAEGLIDVQAAVVNAIGDTIDSAQRDRVAAIGELVARLYRQIGGNEAANRFGDLVNERAGRQTFPAAVPGAADETRLEAVDALVHIQGRLVKHMAVETSQSRREVFSALAAYIETVVGKLVKAEWGLEATLAGFPPPGPEPAEAENPERPFKHAFGLIEDGWPEEIEVYQHNGFLMVKRPGGFDGPTDPSQTRMYALEQRRPTPEEPTPEPTYGEKAKLCREAADRASNPVVARAFREAAHYFSNRSTGVILLMRDRYAYNQQVIQDADVVINQHGVVVKNRHGVGGIKAGEELLDAARPVFPWSVEDEEPWLFPMPDMDRKLSPPEEGFAVGPDDGAALAIITSLSVTAVVVAIIALLVAVF